MGKWSTYRKRAGSPSPSVSSPPPQPSLEVLDSVVYQSATGEADPLGFVELESSGDLGVTWVPQGVELWEPVRQWGPESDYAGLWLRCREQGNGQTYVGYSAYSNILEIP